MVSGETTWTEVTFAIFTPTRKSVWAYFVELKLVYKDSTAIAHKVNII